MAGDLGRGECDITTREKDAHRGVGPGEVPTTCTV